MHQLVCIYGQLHIYTNSWTVSFKVGNVLDSSLTPNLVSRFPNPVPSGIYVPHWAILDVTVCLMFFLYSTIITMHSRMKTIGTPMNRMPLVVSIVSLMLSFFIASKQSFTHFI